MTPWGTYLMAEENFHGYFWTDNKDDEMPPRPSLVVVTRTGGGKIAT